jgi:hypothetical protein
VARITTHILYFLPFFGIIFALLISYFWHEAEIWGSLTENKLNLDLESNKGQNDIMGGGNGYRSVAYFVNVCRPSYLVT